jgi:hypothetical protein
MKKFVFESQSIFFFVSGLDLKYFFVESSAFFCFSLFLALSPFGRVACLKPPPRFYLFLQSGFLFLLAVTVPARSGHCGRINFLLVDLVFGSCLACVLAFCSASTSIPLKAQWFSFDFIRTCFFNFWVASVLAPPSNFSLLEH